MRTGHRILVGLLVGLCFAGGYGARLNVRAKEQAAILAQIRSSVLTPGTRIASAGLEGADVNLQPVETLYGVIKNLREHYVEQLAPKDEGKMTYDALKMMLGSLNDPNTRFVEPAQRQTIEDAQEGKFHGIGAVLAVKRLKVKGLTEEHLIVVAALPSGPAETAGLKPGDDITAIDGKSVLPFDPYQKANKIVNDGRNQKTGRTEMRKQLDAEQKRIENGIAIMYAEDRLMSEDGKTLDLTVVRKGSAKPLKVEVESREFTVDPMTSSVIENSRIGYIKIDCLCRETDTKLGEALADLRSKDVEALVLDLRNLSGGDVNSALGVARWLAPGRKMGTLLKSRGRKSLLSIPTDDDTHGAWKGPIVVLVNSGTARTPEVLAAALRENRVAKLVGEKTYGDFTYTTLTRLRDGSAIIMTTGKFLTASGKDYNGKGVPVDVEVAATGVGDLQLQKAVKLLGAGGNGS